MPETRVIYTLEDVKILLAKEHNVYSESISIYENGELKLDNGRGVGEVEDKTYLFEVVLEEEIKF